MVWRTFSGRIQILKEGLEVCVISALKNKRVEGAAE